MLGQKAILGKFRKMKIISWINSDHNDMRLEINYKKNFKETQTQMLNNMLQNNQWITDEIKEEIKKYLKINENKNTTI